VMGKRMDTDVREQLLASGVTNDNYDKINELCADLLGSNFRPLQDASFDGRNVAAIVMGAVAVALASVVALLQGGCGLLACCGGRESKRSPMARHGSETDLMDDDDDDGDV